MYDQMNKKQALRDFKRNMLNKTLTMFEYKGLPDTLPAVELERFLQCDGYAVIAPYAGELYAFTCGFSGLDAYNRPTTAIISNPALNFNANLELGTEAVVITNDDMRLGLVKIFEHYGTLLNENEITMLVTDYNTRMPFMISASDDNTVNSAQAYLDKIKDGSLGVIGESQLFESLKVSPAANGKNSNFADLYGYQQYLQAQLNNELGLATNNNMKKERLTTNEVAINQNATYPLIDNMLRNRQEAVAKINELFGTSISVAFNSIWSNGVTRDTSDQPTEDVSHETIDDEPTEDVSHETIDDEPTEDVSHETIDEPVEPTIEPVETEDEPKNATPEDKEVKDEKPEPEDEPEDDPEDKDKKGA